MFPGPFPASDLDFEYCGPVLAGPAWQHGLLAVPAGRRGQLAVTQYSGSLPVCAARRGRMLACAARRGRMLAYYYIYTGTASMQTHSVNTASRMSESAWGWSILQDERRRAAARAGRGRSAPRATRPSRAAALTGAYSGGRGHHRQ